MADYEDLIIDWFVLHRLPIYRELLLGSSNHTIIMVQVHALIPAFLYIIYVKFLIFQPSRLTFHFFTPLMTALIAVQLYGSMWRVDLECLAPQRKAASQGRISNGKKEKKFSDAYIWNWKDIQWILTKKHGKRIWVNI